MLHNLIFYPDPQSRAEPIQMTRMTFQCHRRANRLNDSVELLLVLTGVCRSLWSARSFGPLMLSVKVICPVSVNVRTPMPTANVTSAAPVEMDY